MKLTIGMATFDDYDGVYFTVQALRMYHPEVMSETEILIIDNKPDSKASHMLKNLASHAKEGNAGCRYIPMAEPQGTTAPRQRIFDEAHGELVVCMDSHVLVVPGALKRLLDVALPSGATPYRSCFNSILSGPMLYDGLGQLATHFDDYWRAQMWGIWGQAWGCNCYLDSFNFNPITYFTVLQDRQGQCSYHDLKMGLAPRTECPQCKRPYPPLPYDSRNKLLELGYLSLGHNENIPPFEIPGMGLGLFACRKSAWPGFNPHFRGFGGEEMYIHEKFRQAGHKALCLPFLKWGHRFGRPEGPKYVPLLFNKVRNYVLGHLELGMPLDKVYHHFVEELKPPFPAPIWGWMAADPIKHHTIPQPPAGSSPQRTPPASRPQPRATAELPEIQAWLKTQPRDLDQHIDKLVELASQCEQVVEIAHRRESTAALLSAKRLVSYNSEIDPMLTQLVDLYPAKLDLHAFELNLKPFLPDIPETDLLFLDTYHTADRLYKELKHYREKVRRWIVIHDTALFGEGGEGSVPEKPIPGLLPGLRLFMQQHPEWSVIYHTTNQHGLTVIGCQLQDKPKFPPYTEMAANLAAALAKHVSDGLRRVTSEQYQDRLGICNTCPQRNGNRCAVCGCNLSSKASMRSTVCPLGYWPSVPVIQETPVSNNVA